jgi:hypothetical protein
VKFDNWIKYGDPDGSTSVRAIAIALPKWLFDKDIRPLLYTGIFIFTAFVLLSVAYIASSEEKTSSNGISLESKKSMGQFVCGVLSDNDSNQRL